MNTDKFYAEQIANEYAPKQTSKVKMYIILRINYNTSFLFFNLYNSERKLISNVKL